MSPPMIPEMLPCAICGSETEPTRLELLEWREPVDGKRYDHVPRCLDRVACRARTELSEPWPVEDRTPAPPRAAELSDPGADHAETIPEEAPGKAEGLGSFA